MDWSNEWMNLFLKMLKKFQAKVFSAYYITLWIKTELWMEYEWR
jgi:hypothetical protein